nr:hypothetical protein [Tanacetum cinerariifolium]
NINTTQAQQKALVAPVDCLEFEKCNMRLKTDIKPKEATFQVVLDALALTPFYKAFLITADVPAIYISYASGSGDGVDTQSKVPDEHQQKTSGIDEGTGTIPRVPDVPKYDLESKKES